MVKTPEPTSNWLKTVFESVGAYGYVGGSSSRNNDKKRLTNENEDGAPTMEMVELGGKRTKNVLVLMSDTGGGHRASAEAIRDAFKIEFGDQYKDDLRVESRVGNGSKVTCCLVNGRW